MMCRVLNTFAVVFLLFLSISWSAAMSDRPTNTSIGNCVISDEMLSSLQVAGSPWQSCWDDRGGGENTYCKNLTTILRYTFKVCGGVPWPWAHCANDKTVMQSQQITYWPNEWGGCGEQLSRCKITTSGCDGDTNIPEIPDCAGEE